MFHITIYKKNLLFLHNENFISRKSKAKITNKLQVWGNNEEGMKDIIKRFNLINKRISKIKRILNG